MSSELQGSFAHGFTTYFLVRDRNANIWNVASGALEPYNTAHYANYTITGTEQGTASAFYVGNMPAAAPPGFYGAVMKQQVGGAPAETDPTTDAGNVDWNGSNIAQLSDISVSGFINPIMLPRGWAVPNFPVNLKSSADHITPFTSGIVSGQISKDGGPYQVLQSGGFSEVGFGTYSLVGLTSGDLNAGTVTLRFTAVGISGGSADPLVQSFILQRTSGH